MKIALLSRNRKLYSSARIIEEAQNRGHEIVVIDVLVWVLLVVVVQFLFFITFFFCCFLVMLQLGHECVDPFHILMLFQHAILDDGVTFGGNGCTIMF